MEINVANQLVQWVDGNPVHNDERDECTPDFSCCRGIEFMADKDARERFLKADKEGDDKTKNAMLGMFLGAAFGGSKVEIYIAGDGSISDSEN